MAQMILEENQNVVGVDIAKEAVKEIKKESEQKKEGGKLNEKKERGVATRTKSNK